MNILRAADKKFFRLVSLIIFIPLQSCSNTIVGEKLEKSFDVVDNQKSLVKISNEESKSNKIKKVQVSQQINNKSKVDMKVEGENEILISSKDKPNQKQNKSNKKVIFNPQPYRIILKLSSANPSAPAETVTKALRKAGVQFEVEKIEQFNQESLLNNTSSKK